MAVATRGTRAPVSAPGKTSKATSKSSRKAKAPRARTATRKAVTPPHHHSVPSSKTVSRDVVEKTPQPDQQSQILELTNRLSQLEEERARTQTQHRVHKSRSHRRHHHRRCDSQSSSDSEEGDGPMVSFLHAEGTKPFLSLHERYRAVNIKFFKQIFFGTFKPDRLTHLAQNPTDHLDSKEVQEVNGMVHLLRCFEVYGQAVCYYAVPTVALRLQEALSDYRVRLAELSIHYKFDSIRAYHHAFMNTRIITAQDDPIAWSIEDRRCNDLLVRKLPPMTNNKPYSGGPVGPKSSSSGGPFICRNFNEGRCTREHCKYSHICLNCQHDHPANTCSKTHSATNQIPLGNRISKAE